MFKIVTFIINVRHENINTKHRQNEPTSKEKVKNTMYCQIKLYTKISFTLRCNH